MQEYYLAIDIGASSGRHILGYFDDGRIRIQEIYRFDNAMKEHNGHLVWPIDEIFEHILTGLKKCKELGKVPTTVGIDTWGVDFVLLDSQNHILGDAVAYRDFRTNGIDKDVYDFISEEDLYRRTGIQKQNFNTIYQLMAIKNQTPDLLDKAETLLLLPDYFHFRLCGNKQTEYTNASTTQLVNLESHDWDWPLIDLLNFPAKLFRKIVEPGTLCGVISSEIQKVVGFNAKVILPATHDTGSAFVAVPKSSNRSVYISSGTWSLVGVERPKPDTNLRSMYLNFTNEGGAANQIRYLKNIMGLWMIQCIRKELDHRFSFEELCDLASHSDIKSIVNVNDKRFLAPLSMIDMIKTVCMETNQTIPVHPGEISAVVYNSLAFSYKSVIHELETITGQNYDTIHIIGGGANARYLNSLTAKMTHKIVKAGPVEATAIGNIMVQMMSQSIFDSIDEARECLINSIEIETYMEN